MIRKIAISIVEFVSAIALVALAFATIDSIISGIFPQFNGVMVFKFSEFFPRSFCIYFLYMIPFTLLGLPFFDISKRMPRFNNKDAKVVYNTIGVAISSVIPIILFEIPHKLNLSYFKPVFLIADIAGLLVMIFLFTYFIPLVLCLVVEQFPAFLLKSMRVTSYLSLVTVGIILFSLTILPELTRPSYNPDAPNLLVISIDTLRKDHLSYYGYDRNETSNIDEFMESATTFNNAYCSASWTLPSLAAFLTGYQPSVCGVDRLQKMPEEMVNFTEILRNNGYKTECYNTNFYVYPEYGYDKGFDIYMARDDIKLLLPFYGTRLYRYAKTLSGIFRDKLGYNISDTEFNSNMTIDALENQSERPFFLWCHFLDPHTIYTPPNEYIPSYRGVSADSAIAFRDISIAAAEWDYSAKNKTELMMLYDGETAYVDEQVGLILTALNGTGYAENTVVVMFNDHGEEFWDHGRWSHGYSAYPEVVDMIFAISDPNLSKQQPKSNDYIAHLDIMPTLLEALGIEAPPAIQGKSFYSSISSDIDQSNAILCEYVMRGEEEIKSVRMDGFLFQKNMVTGDTELYDIKNDPKALSDLSGTLPDIENNLSNELDKFIVENEELRVQFDRESKIALPEDRADALRGLGYMGD